MISVVSATEPSPDLLKHGVENIQDLIVYIARISNPTNQSNTKTGEKLINYLIDNNHWSPFEMVNICLEINTTRDIARQILRHRSFSYQEFSQRYASVNALSDSLIKREARLQDFKNRQNSIKTDNEKIKTWWERTQENLEHEILRSYNTALEMGIAKEVARAIMPKRMTPSRIYMNGTIRSWIHYCQLRCANGTQLEHREIARECARVIADYGFSSMSHIVPEAF